MLHRVWGITSSWQLHRNSQASLGITSESCLPDSRLCLYITSVVHSLTHGVVWQAKPTFTQALNNLGVVLTAQGFAAEAYAMLQASLAAAPGYAEAWNNLGVLQRDLGQISEALDSYQCSIDLAPEARNASQNRLLALNYILPGTVNAVYIDVFFSY